ncbi:MAG TPA: single-stranded-DNA-specific exonuclease RecJ, partial [Hellea balneolensis]|nr:single-stranded-DNA-specific exonuclease RecJ [Hellea balneolensis]
KKITVFADYDVDGGTSAAQLIRWGRGIGHDFGLYVPDRIKEGFGPTPQAFTTLKEDGVDLVITVDCGAAATQALIHAASIELDVIVIDHHLMDGGTPPCAALVNPNQPDDHSGLGYLSAAGVTFMLLVALNREARRRGLETPDLLKFLDLTALGTVCDVMPLTGLNRVFVAQGMKVLENTPNPGLKALIEVANSEPPFTPYHAGFIIGPRINAGGRIGRADMGARLLSSDDPAEISEFARILDQTNVERRAIQEDMLREAVDKIEGRELGHELICIAQENWHAGIIGVVAGRLKDKYERPAIVIGIDETGIGKGSGRSLKGVNLGAAIQAAKQEGLLIAGGGHEMAAGLTIERDKIDDFTAFMNARLAQEIEIATQNLTTKIDALLSASGATPELIAKINSLGPFGTGNPEPVFVFPDMRITYAKALNGGHIRCAFEDSGGQRISGIAFRAEDNGIADILMHQDTARVHVVGRIKQDTWNGRTKIDLQVSDIALAASD